MLNDNYGAPQREMEVREPPHNIQLEQGLLGAILINNHAFERIGDLVTAEHFFDPVHASIFDVIAKTIQSGRQATPLTIQVHFETAPKITDTMSVPQYLGRLAAGAAPAINVKDYAQAIRDLWVLREMIILGEDMINTAYSAPIDFPAESQILEAETRLYALAEDQPSSVQEISFDKAVNEALDRANEAYKSKGMSIGLSTGITDLDEKLGGLQPSDLVILAGRPSMGKTALATNMAFNVATKGRVSSDGEIVQAPVHFFSLEMSGEQLATRIMAEQSELSSERIRRGRITELEFSRLSKSAQKLASAPLYIDQTGGISIAQLAQRARRLKRRHGTALIVVDYLQLMSGAKRRDGNRVAEITEITTGLKALAKELQVPVVALSQLSRKVEERADKRPQLADLKESGSIEQDADVVMFVYRDEYYLERQKPPVSDFAGTADWQDKMNSAAGKAEIIIGKQRHGPLGIVDVAFDASLTRFSNLARNDQDGAR